MDNSERYSLRLSHPGLGETRCGKSVASNLTNGAKEILYLSGSSLISTPIPIQPLGPLFENTFKSTDRVNTWTKAKGKLTLQPLVSAGRCGTLDLLPGASYGDQELIIWGDGFIKPSGTIVYRLRRCTTLAVAISDDEGGSWCIIDVPGSQLPPFVVGDLTYLFIGNVLVPEPISLAFDGIIYAIWFDNNYILQMSCSTDNAKTWSSPAVIGAPGNSSLQSTTTYLPALTQHPWVPNRTVLAYYGSIDGGKAYHAYVTKTANLNATNPIWTSVIGDNASQPMQANMDATCDQGYGYPLYYLVEFCDVKWTPDGKDWVASFARRMCTVPSTHPVFYDASSCVDGWNFAQCQWQGFGVFGTWGSRIWGWRLDSK